MAFVTASAEATSAANSITTAAKNMTGMTLFVIAVSNFGTSDAATPITDTSSNIYTLISRSSSFSGAYGSLHYCLTPTVSSSQTFTYHTSSTGDFPSIAVFAWDGASPTFDTAPAWVGTASASSLNTNNTATTAQASELLVTMLGGSNGGAAITASDHGATAATWTTDEQQTSGSGEPIALAHSLVSNGPGAYGATWTFSAGGAAHTNVSAFKAATGGLPPGLGPEVGMPEPFHFDVASMR
jgi:hypothetical protein